MKKGTIVPMLVMTVLPAKFVAGLLCQQVPEVITAIIVQTVCTVSMWI